MTKRSLHGTKESTNRSTHTLNDTRQTSKNVLSTVSTTGERLVGLQEHVSSTALDSENSNQSLKRDILQQIDAGFSRQADMQTQGHPLLLAGIAKLLDAALEKDRENHNTRSYPPLKEAIPASPNMEAGSPAFSTAIRGDELSASIPPKAERVKRYKAVSYTTYWTPLGNIIIRTLKPHRLLEDKNSDRDATEPIFIRKLDIQLKLGIVNRVFQFTQTRRKHDLVSEMSLRTRNLVDGGGLACTAVINSDIATIKAMFENGEASIFDVIGTGASYLFIACCDLSFLVRHQDQDKKRVFLKIQNMVTFLIDSGMNMDYHFWPSFLDCMMMGCWSRRWTLDEEIILQNIMRKLLSCAPDGVLGEINNFYFDQHNLQNPLSQLFLQNNQFLAFDEPAEPDHEGYIHLHENKRMMLLDPYGQRIQSTLNKTKQMHYILHDVDDICSPDDFDPNSSLFVLLDIYNKDRSLKFRSACLNRLVLFLQLQRELELGIEVLMWAQDQQGIERKMTVTEFAITHNVTELWVEALKLADWTDFEIMHLWDEYPYCGVTELVDGQVWYQTRKEWWKETKEALYLGIDDEEESFSRTFPTNPSSAHRLIVDVMNTVFFIFCDREGQVPGAWQSQEEWTMSPEDKARLDEKVHAFERAAGFLLVEDDEKRSDMEFGS